MGNRWSCKSDNLSKRGQRWSEESCEAPCVAVLEAQYASLCGHIDAAQLRRIAETAQGIVPMDRVTMREVKRFFAAYEFILPRGKILVEFPYFTFGGGCHTSIGEVVRVRTIGWISDSELDDVIGRLIEGLPEVTLAPVNMPADLGMELPLGS